ncbi:hypothetical protein ACSHWB_31930 [Lentzea sp. HUAS TT2]|uniref:hypothetical protein n=1 Tax=Lentzea sp. HUAS TT2 TaxID=3447454 RepID=UPI003F70941F
MAAAFQAVTVRPDSMLNSPLGGARASNSTAIPSAAGVGGSTTSIAWSGADSSDVD